MALSTSVVASASVAWPPTAYSRPSGPMAAPSSAWADVNEGCVDHAAATPSQPNTVVCAVWVLSKPPIAYTSPPGPGDAANRVRPAGSGGSALTPQVSAAGLYTSTVFRALLVELAPPMA